ncbi:SDR family NAD(P)-dependent oxidoreductase [Pseudoalteromonas sp. JBTF-M23]|uniref:SDR family NAD(P)-dependent oxidoreductase n=1 Tax=Pseudoalteromonas caenipelagi TaxID=2726988 RepID=A0A849VC15_9GAMM|nr:SDR family NAD(P)-dependent oxidoreductase [Pseudoalteromonas caenipelagi]NOU50113.1 SDR family NAD(P)-dependent oxidoreductase [Pseudoalteromonas caenipelagi]
MSKNAIIVIGANGAIAQAFIKEQRARYPNHPLITISRGNMPLLDDYHTHIECDYSEAQINLVAENIKASIQLSQSISIFNGQLHNGQFGPEKRLEDINERYLTWLLKTNTITPMLWLKAIGQHLTHQSACVITVLSARVASIDDNVLGGWYSYRASKAALNMAVKTASIELARRAKHCKCVLFHPGTTDSPLSKPFQNNVPEGKLFPPSFVAQQLSNLIDSREHNTLVDYIDWQGNRINW